MLPKNCKITLFGDSISKGIVYEDNELKKLSENATKLVAQHFGITIENLSFYGQTLKRLVQKGTIDQYISNINKTDNNNIAVISLGGNDSDYDWKEVAQSPSVNHLPKTPPKEFEMYLGDTIKKMKQKNIEVIITNIPPINSKRYFENVISKLADKDKVLEFLGGDIENIYRHQELFNLIITKCAIRNNCTLLDVRQDLLWDKSCLDKICDDGIHPNKKGHIEIANSIIAQLEKNNSPA